MMPRLVSVVALLALGCHSPPALDQAPGQLAGILLHHQVSGEKALDAVRYFYADTSDVVGGWTAHYGDAPSLMLYVATTRDTVVAGTLITRTLDRVTSGETPFRDPSPLNQSGGSVYRMTGQKQIHYLFRFGADVIWLSADPDVARAALSDLLGGRNAAPDAS